MLTESSHQRKPSQVQQHHQLHIKTMVINHVVESCPQTRFDLLLYADDNVAISSEMKQ